MSSYIGYNVPSGEASINTTPNGTSSGEIVLGTNAIFEVTTFSANTGAQVASFIKFGNAGMGAATANDILLPANFTTLWETGSAFDRVRVFSATGATLIGIQKLSRS